MFCSLREKENFLKEEMNSNTCTNVIEVHPMSNNPTKAWDLLKNKVIHDEVVPLPLDTEVTEGAVRFVCMSDTHSAMSRMKFKVPFGDVFIHAGDFTRYGSTKEIQDFNAFLGTLPHRYKIVIAGNHELGFDEKSERQGNFCLGTSNKKASPQMLTEGLYLEDSSCIVHGMKIYGTPWQPEYCGWAFNLPRGQACLDKWNQIPDDTDVLITHTPPLGQGDFCVTGVRAGCVELLSTVQTRVKPKYHVFGHIHEGYGITTNKQTVFINASTCDIRYRPNNAPIIFDIPLPAGVSKIDHYVV